MRGNKPPDYQAIARLRAAMRSLERTTEQAAREHGLTPQRYLLLLMVKGATDGSERALVSDVAERLQLAAHTVTGAVGRAERAGLVRRDPCPDDGRRTWISLTPEGERRLEAVVTSVARERDELAAAVAQTESDRGA